MSNTAALTNAPLSMKLSGKEYLISPLNDQDASMLDEYVRSVFMRTAVLAAQAAGERSVIAQKIIETAVAQAPLISFLSAQGAALIKSIDGVSRILWQGARHNHPGLTHEEVRKAMYGNKDSVQEANRIFKALNIDPLQSLIPPASAKKAPVATKASRKKSYMPTSAKSTSSRRRK